VAINIGTSGALRVLWEERFAAIPPGLWCYRADRRRFVAGGALSNAGDLFAWARDQLRLPGDDEVEERLGRIEPDSHGLTILPFWSGERSTGWASHARGAITGINLDTGSVEIVRAMFEAVAYRFAAILDLVVREITSPSLIVVSGAAATASPGWMQILSDVFGSSLLVPDYGEASSRGAALMALESLGIIADAADAPPVSGRTYRPDSRNHERYLRARQRQEQLYDSIVRRGL
jgi:gluconokinase